MNITYYGATCFRLQNNQISILIDPPESKTGLTIPRMQNNVTLFTHDINGKVNAQSFVINCPGEYEIKGCFVYGVGANGDMETKTIYLIEVEDLRIAHLGNITNAKLTELQLDKFDNVDILLVPVGGDDSLDSKKAREIVNSLEPRIVVPMNYKIEGLKTKVDSLDKFQKELSAKSESVNKYKIVKKDLLQEEIRMVIIEPSK